MDSVYQIASIYSIYVAIVLIVSFVIFVVLSLRKVEPTEIGHPYQHAEPSFDLAETEMRIEELEQDQIDLMETYQSLKSEIRSRDDPKITPEEKSQLQEYRILAYHSMKELNALKATLNRR